MNDMNRTWNADNQFQQIDKHKRVLCLCSAGLLRSPTTSLVLAAAPYNFNTRAAGLESSYALIPVDDVLLYWADEIVVMTQDQVKTVKQLLNQAKLKDKPVICLDIPDNFHYRHPDLIDLIRKNYDERVSSGLTDEEKA